MAAKVLASGHEAKEMGEEEKDGFYKDFTGYEGNLVRLTPDRWLFPGIYTRFADKIYKFKWRTTDAVVMTYPKCGTTWTQEIVWTMRNNPDLSDPRGQQSLHDRVPFIDCDMFLPADLSRDDPLLEMTPEFIKLCPDADPNNGVYLQLSEATPDPRTIKTHLPFSLLNPHLLDKSKVVYVARNPKAVAVSYYHHARLFLNMNYKGSLEKFIKYFIDDYLGYGPYWLHLKEAWEQRQHPNLHLVFYEDLKADIMGELKRLDTFLGTALSDDQLKKVAEHTSFSQMKSRQNEELEKEYSNKEVWSAEGGFYRKGESRDWENKLTPELEAQMDAWINDKFDFGVNFK